MAGVRRADDGRVDDRVGQGEAQGAFEGIVPRPFFRQQIAHRIPVGAAVELRRVRRQQSGVGDGALGHDPHARPLGRRQDLVEGLLT